MQSHLISPVLFLAIAASSVCADDGTSFALDFGEELVLKNIIWPDELKDMESVELILTSNALRNTEWGFVFFVRGKGLKPRNIPSHAENAILESWMQCKLKQYLSNKNIRSNSPASKKLRFAAIGEAARMRRVLNLAEEQAPEPNATGATKFILEAKVGCQRRLNAPCTTEGSLVAKLLRSLNL